MELGFSRWSHKRFQFLRKCFATYTVPELDPVDTEAEGIIRNKVGGFKSFEICNIRTFVESTRKVKLGRDVLSASP